MEAYEIVHQVKVYSQSPLHHYITGPETANTTVKSKMKPYRRRQGLFSFLGLGDILDELNKDDERAAQIARPTTEV